MSLGDQTRLNFCFNNIGLSLRKSWIESNWVKIKENKGLEISNFSAQIGHIWLTKTIGSIYIIIKYYSCNEYFVISMIQVESGQG